jgi:hypothetical protein
MKIPITNVSWLAHCESVTWDDNGHRLPIASRSRFVYYFQTTIAHSMAWTIPAFSVMAASLIATIRIGLSPLRFLLDGLSFNRLDEAQLRKCTEADVRTDVKTKKHKTHTSTAKPKYESITFQTCMTNDRFYPYLPGYQMLQVFLGFAITCGLTLFISLVLAFTPFRNYAPNFLPPAALSFLGFTVTALLNSFGDVHHYLRNILFPCGYSIIAFGVYRALPTGPCDISLLFHSSFTTRVFAATAVFYLGCIYATSVTRLCELYRQLHNPRDGILRTSTYLTFARRVMGIPRKVLELLLQCVPGNVFIFVAVRFLWKFLPDWVMDLGFVVCASAEGIARIVLARDCVQLLVITKSLQGLLLLDDKRTTAAVRLAQKANLESINSICPNLIAFLAPGCVNIAMVLLYAVSWAIDGREKVVARIAAMFVLVASDFCIASQQFNFAD